MAIIINHHRSGRRSFSTILLRLLSSYSQAMYPYKDKEGNEGRYTFLAQIQLKVKKDYPGTNEKIHVYTGGRVRYDNSLPDDVITVIIDIDTPIIADHAFAEIEKLKRVIFHDNITKIGIRAFKKCSGLEGEVVIPEKVTKIEKGTFEFCPNLKRVIFHDNITEIGDCAFDSSGIEGEVVIPEKVTNIEKWTFKHCPNLKRVIFHDNITEIGAWAFRKTGIEEVDIPKKVTTIKKGTFSFCKLRSLVLHGDITEIHEDAFEESGIEGKVVIPPKIHLENYDKKIISAADKVEVGIFYNSCFPPRALFRGQDGRLATFDYRKSESNSYNLDELTVQVAGPCYIYQGGTVKDRKVSEGEKVIVTVIVHPDTPIIDN